LQVFPFTVASSNSLSALFTHSAWSFTSLTRLRY